MDNKQLINNIIYKLKLLKEKQEKRIKNASQSFDLRESQYRKPRGK